MCPVESNGSILTNIGMIFAVYASEKVVLGSIRSNFHPVDVEEANNPAASSGSKASHILHPEGPVSFRDELGQSAPPWHNFGRLKGVLLLVALMEG